MLYKPYSVPGGINKSLRHVVASDGLIDVFVSHKSDDTDEACKLAEAISSYGLSAWVDVEDPNITGDGPGMACYIEDRIKNSRALMVVATGVTRESMWVPFEIGMAFTRRKLLASYTPRGSVDLPSFLGQFPVISPTGLSKWCAAIKDSRGRTPTSLRSLDDDANRDRSLYVKALMVAKNG